MNGSPDSPPPVWRWYVAYCIAMAALYAAIMVGSLFMIVVALAGTVPRDASRGEYLLLGGMFTVLGFVLLVPFAVAPFLPKKPWSWTFGLVLICIGMTSACCMPASIPLLIFWLKPETRAFFGKPN